MAKSIKAIKLVGFRLTKDRDNNQNPQITERASTQEQFWAAFRKLAAGYFVACYYLNGQRIFDYNDAADRLPR